MPEIMEQVGQIKYEFVASPWLTQGPCAWVFASMPKELAKEIRDNLQWREEGWGRLKARAQIKNSAWVSAIWFDTKQGTYLLPLKAAIRKKEKIEIGNDVKITVWV